MKDLQDLGAQRAAQPPGAFSDPESDKVPGTALPH